MKTFNTTLVYIEKEGKYLMLHRIKKKRDVNHDKWIGVGGKLEWGESPEEGMEREVFEETGLTVTSYIYCGLVTFVSEGYDVEDEMGYMHLFKVTDFVGELKTCDEGELLWVRKEKLLSLPHWKGDELFLSLIADGKRPFFSMKLSYEGGELIEARLDGADCFITERLILRPWELSDAEDLYRYARDTEVGSSAGWKPHRSVEESEEVILQTLSVAGNYAVILKETNEVIGAVGLFAGKKEKRGLGSEKLQAEIGYWIGKPHQKKGIVTEAAQALLTFGFEELGLKKIWLAYYDGNKASKRVAEKLGFRYHHTVEKSEVPLLSEVRTEHFTVLPKEAFRPSGEA